MTNIATEAQAISGGDYLGTWFAAGAFDGSLTYNSADAWASEQTNASSPDQVSAPAYIGQDFGEGNVARIDSLMLFQHPSIDGNSLIGPNKIALEHSDDGVTWVELEKISPDTGNAYMHVVAAPEEHRFWRLRALANVPGLSGSIWAMRELEMHGEVNAVSAPVPTLAFAEEHEVVELSDLQAKLAERSADGWSAVRRAFFLPDGGNLKVFLVFVKLL